MIEEQSTPASLPRPRTLNGYSRLMRRLDARRVRRVCALTSLLLIFVLSINILSVYLVTRVRAARLAVT